MVKKINRPEQEYWYCIIGPANLNGIDRSVDSDMREAVSRAFCELTGESHEHLWSGWGLTEEDKDAALTKLTYDAPLKWLYKLNPDMKPK